MQLRRFGICCFFFLFTVCCTDVNVFIFVEDCFTGSVMPKDNMMFTTWDQDNDAAADNCAELFSSGWWHKHCNCANPNGLYLSGDTSVYGKGITYEPWLGFFYSLKFTELKVRRLVQWPVRGGRITHIHINSNGIIKVE